MLGKRKKEGEEQEPAKKPTEVKPVLHVFEKFYNMKTHVYDQDVDPIFNFGVEFEIEESLIQVPLYTLLSKLNSMKYYYKHNIEKVSTFLKELVGPEIAMQINIEGMTEVEFDIVLYKIFNTFMIKIGCNVIDGYYQCEITPGNYISLRDKLISTKKLLFKKDTLMVETEQTNQVMTSLTFKELNQIDFFKSLFTHIGYKNAEPIFKDGKKVGENVLSYKLDDMNSSLEVIFGVYKGLQTTGFLKDCDKAKILLERFCVNGAKCENDETQPICYFKQNCKYTSKSQDNGTSQLTISIDIMYFPELLRLYFKTPFFEKHPDQQVMIEGEGLVFTSIDKILFYYDTEYQKLVDIKLDKDGFMKRLKRLCLFIYIVYIDFVDKFSVKMVRIHPNTYGKKWMEIKPRTDPSTIDTYKSELLQKWIDYFIQNKKKYADICEWSCPPDTTLCHLEFRNLSSLLDSMKKVVEYDNDLTEEEKEIVTKYRRQDTMSISIVKLKEYIVILIKCFKAFIANMNSKLSTDVIEDAIQNEIRAEFRHKSLKSPKTKEKSLKSHKTKEKSLKSSKKSLKSSKKSLKSPNTKEKSVKSSKTSLKSPKSLKSSKKSLKSPKTKEKSLKSPKTKEKSLKSSKTSLKSPKTKEKLLKSSKKSLKSSKKSLKSSKKSLKSSKRSY